MLCWLGPTRTTQGSVSSSSLPSGPRTRLRQLPAEPTPGQFPAEVTSEALSQSWQSRRPLPAAASTGRVGMAPTVLVLVLHIPAGSIFPTPRKEGLPRPQPIWPCTGPPAHRPPPRERRELKRGTGQGAPTLTHGQGSVKFLGQIQGQPRLTLALGRAAVGQVRLAPCWPPPGLHACPGQPQWRAHPDKIPEAGGAGEHPGVSPPGASRAPRRFGRQNWSWSSGALVEPASFEGRSARQRHRPCSASALEPTWLPASESPCP